MRITYRARNNRDYWEDRWSNVSIDARIEKPDAYPLKYAEMTVEEKDGLVLEAGCGAGRVLRYYKEAGFRITGIDFITSVIERLKLNDPQLNLQVGDITNLHFRDQIFKYVLAFGLYHNLENGLDKALRETCRVMRSGGKLCASFRADNLQTRLIDIISDLQNKHSANNERHFHKVNFTRGEIIRIVGLAGFIVEHVFSVENMPVFYKFRLFRARTHKNFNENLARREGYRLSTFGMLIQKLLVKVSPSQFCNNFVIIAKKV